MARDVEPVGLAEIAQRLGYPVDTVRVWRGRSLRGELRVPFPEAQPTTVSGYPWWNWTSVWEWAEATGRVRARPATPRAH
jgi:hypothetical protein